VWACFELVDQPSSAKSLVQSENRRGPSIEPLGIGSAKLGFKWLGPFSQAWLRHVSTLGAARSSEGIRLS